MKRNFLLMLLLTLLPVVGWAQTNPTAKTGLEYTGSSQALVTAGSGNRWYWRYEVSTSSTRSTFSTDAAFNSGSSTIVPQKTDADTYYVHWVRRYYYDVNRSTWNSAGSTDSGTIEVKISKADNVVTDFACANIALGDIASPTCTAKFGAGTEEWRYDTNSAGSFTTLNPDAVGLWFVQLTIPGTPNYNEFTTVYSNPIKVAGKATVTGIDLKAGLEFDNTEQSLIEGTPKLPADYDKAHGGVKYFVSTGTAPTASDAGEDVAVAKDAGKYYVWYKVLDDGDIYIDGDWTPVGGTAVKISQAAFTTDAAGFTAPTATTPTYTGSAQKWFNDGVAPTGGDITYSYTAGGPYAATVADKTNVGEVTKLYYKVSESKNYLASDELSIDISMNKANAEVTTAPAAKAASFTYNGSAQTLISEGVTNFGTVQYSLDGTNWKTYAEVKDQTNAGKYNYQYKVVGNDNFNGVDAASVDEIEIEQAPVAISADPTLNIGWTYDAYAHSLVSGTLPTVTGGTIKFKAQGAKETSATEFEDNSDPKGARVNADTYTVSYELIADNTGNYKNVAAKPLGTVTVAKKEVIIAGKTYEGTIEDFFDKTDGKVDGTKPLYTQAQFLNDIEVYSTDDKAAVLNAIVTMTAPAFESLNVGDNTVTFEAVDPDDNTTNYTPNVLGNTGSLKIKTMAATVTTPPTGVTTTYNTNEQSLLNVAGEANGGTVVYSLVEAANPDTWTEDIKATDADVYTVYYSVKPDKFYTYTDPVDEFTATINPAAVTPATIAAASDLVFEKGLAQPLITVTGETQHGTMMYSWKKTADAAYSAWSEQIPAQVNAGSYDVKYYVKADENYENTAATTITGIEIAPKPLADSDFALNPATDVYTGENLKPAVETELTTDDYNVTADAEMIEVKDYTFTFEGKGNYTGKKEKTFTITQNQAVISNLAIEGWTYGSYDPVKNAPKANTTFGEVTFSYTDENEEALPGVPVDAGTYFVVANVAASANWAAADPVKFQFDIAQKPVTPTAPKAHALTYNGLPQALIDAGSAEGATIQYFVGDAAPEEESTDWQAAIPEEKNAATYKVWYKFTVDPNYTFGNALEEGSVDVKLNPASITYSLGNQTVTFTGNKAIPVENEAYQITNGALMVGDGDAFTFVFTEIDATNANENGVPFTKLETVWNPEKPGEQNYAIQFNLTGKLFIQKAEVLVTAPTAPELFFNDANQELIATAATAKFKDEPFDFIYSGNGISSSDYTKIIGKEAGEYEISWKVNDPGKNFKFVDADKKDAAEGKFTTTIGAKKTWDAEVPAFADGDIVETYNGTDFAKTLDPVKFMLSDDDKVLTAVQDYTVEVNGKVLATKDEKNVGKIYDITATEIKNAGVYTVTYKGVANYAGLTEEYTIKVLPKNIKEFADKDFENIPQAKDLVYDKKKDNYVEPVVKYVVSEESTLTLVKATDKQDNDYTLAVTKAGEEVTEVRNAGVYTYTFNGKGNYTGEKKFTVTINKAELIVIAPNATKTYDAKTVVEDDEFEELTYSGLQKGDHVDLGELKVADVVTVPANAINVGEYTLTIDVTEFPKQENYEISETNTLPGTLTINPAAPVKISFNKDAKFGKQYSQKDDLSFTAADLVVNEGDGELFDGLAKAAPLLVLSREEGEDVGDYTLNINFATTPKATAEAAATFKKNYEDVTFGTGTFRIDPLKAALKVSIAATSSTYNGKAPQLAWADDLSNMVVTGLPEGKKKDGIFTTLPTITIVDDDDNVVTDATANAGEYNIQLSGGVSKNYTVVSLVGSYYTIEPVAVEAEFNTIPVAAVGVPAEEIMDQVTFTVKAVYEEDEATLAANMDKFEAQWDDLADLVDKDGKIKEGADGKNALVIAYTGKEAEANFIIENAPVYGSLNIGTEGGEIALNDGENIVTYASEGTTVTFSNSRAIKADVWQACVLPCTISIQEFSKAFGYAAIDVLDDERTQGDEIHFSLKVTGNIEAGVPFLLKANGNVDNFTKITLNDVDVASTAALVDEGVNVVTDPDNKVKFIGTFETVNLTTSGYRYISGGKWYNTKDGYANPYVIRPLRAYLDLTEMTSAADARIFIEEPDGTETAIDAIEFANEINGESIYTVDGKKVSKAAQKGIYIQNGKKIAVK